MKADGWCTPPFSPVGLNLISETLLIITTDWTDRKKRMKPFNIWTSLSAEKVSKPVVGSSQKRTGGSVNTYYEYYSRSMIVIKNRRPKKGKYLRREWQPFALSARQAFGHARHSNQHILTFDQAQFGEQLLDSQILLVPCPITAHFQPSLLGIRRKAHFTCNSRRQHIQSELD